ATRPARPVTVALQAPPAVPQPLPEATAPTRPRPPVRADPPAAKTPPAPPQPELDAPPPLAEAPPRFDRTHLGPKGAALFSGQVMAELLRLKPELAAAQTLVP
ncbi:hypothetical protein WDZ92_46385, partial [Nostoc sp. NIES-2111]